MKATELLELLKEFYRDKLAMRQRHAAVARHVSGYEFNNTYQYVIAREDVQLNWLRDAIADLESGLRGAASGDAASNGSAPEPEIGAGKGEAAERSLIAEDREGAQAFVDKWRPRVEAVHNARHRSMLRVTLGEVLEFRRFFDQAVAGRADLLGRRADGAGTGGGVIPTRWVE